jgi:hypothetical protein
MKAGVDQNLQACDKIFLEALTSAWCSRLRFLGSWAGSVGASRNPASTPFSNSDAAAAACVTPTSLDPFAVPGPASGCSTNSQGVSDTCEPDPGEVVGVARAFASSKTALAERGLQCMVNQRSSSPLEGLVDPVNILRVELSPGGDELW